jgi:hypothetical protein
MRTLGRNEPEPLCVTVVVDPPGRHNMNVSRAYGTIFANRKRIRTILLAEGKSAVVWDASVTADEVRAFIAEMDAAMSGIGFAENGKTRLFVAHDVAPPKFKVAEIFNKPGKLFLVPPHETPEEFRKNFDHPHLLHHVQLGSGAHAFIHVNDRKNKSIADVTAEVLARHGITDPKEVEKLPKARWNQIASEIMAELRKRDN